MRLLPSHSLPSFLLVLTLAAVLIALGALQYRWIEQFSGAERTRLENHLQGSAGAFLRDFNIELMELGSYFRSGRTARSEFQWREYQERFQEWLRHAHHPKLVAGVYAARLDDTLVQRLDAPEIFSEPDSSGFLPAARACADAVPPEIATDRGRGRFTPWHFATVGQETVLIIPIRVSDRYPFPSGARDTLQGYLFVELNQTFLQDELLPQLFQRTFGGSRPADFHLAILAGGEQKRVVYQSDPNTDPLALDSADLEVEVLRPLGRGFPREPLGSVSQGPPLPTGRPIPFVPCREDDAWLLAVRHSSGSVDAAVASLRWRNLAVAGGILAILMLSMLLLIASTRRAERLAQLQMEFAAGVSHELRTPLSVIRLVADNLACGITASGESVRQAGALLLRESRKLSTMVDHAMQFTTLGAGRKPLSVQPVRIDEITRQAVEDAAPLIEEAGFKVDTHIAPGLPEVAANPNALVQCLHNLISNALKYGGPDRRIEVRAERNGEPGNPSVQLSVIDNGPGVSNDELPHIFDPFYQGARDGGVKAQGVGLGLSLTKEMMEAMGGRISVDTSEQGSRFTLHIRQATAIGDGETNSRS